MKKLFNYFIGGLFLFELAITSLAAHSEGFESENVGIGLFFMLFTAILIPTKK